MPTNYTPNAGNNPTTITLPADLEPADAEAFNVAYRAIADKAAYALATRAAIAAINTFTRGQIVDPTSESEPLLKTDRYPGDITVDNRWALVFEFRYKASPERNVRLFTGGLSGIGRMAWTMNTWWDVANQLWTLEDVDAEGAAIIWRDDTFSIHHVSPGVSPFQTWPNTGGWSDAGTIKTVGEFRYAQTKTRVRTIPVTSAAGAVSYSGADGAVFPTTLDDHGYIRFPLRLPPGAVLQKVNVLHNINSSATETFAITRRRPTWDPFDPVTPSESVLATVDSDTTVGAHITSVTVSAAVDRYDELCLRWTPSALLSNNVHAITVEWADQGPTPI